MDELLDIFNSDLSEIDKLARSFDHITGIQITHAAGEIELLKAMGDQQGLVKEQIKMETLKHTRSVFQDCFWRATGRKAWDD